MPEEVKTRHDASPGERIEMPAPTAWPMVLALGVTLSAAGMVTEGYVTAVGVILALLAMRGWLHQVLPREQHELLRVASHKIDVKRSRQSVARLKGSSSHQQIQPVETFSLLAGLYGGISGGTAMIVPALLYGLIRHGSIWYAVNLLAAGGFPSWASQPNSFFAEFHLKGLLAAIAIHSVSAPLVGLLYAALLPIYPKRPILTAGLVIPLFWSAMLWGVLGLVSPILNQRIDWLWFIPSQLAFGFVTGYVVNRYVHLRSKDFQDRSFAERAGLHSDVTSREKSGGKE